MEIYIPVCIFSCFFAWLYAKSKSTKKMKIKKGYIDLSPEKVTIFLLMVVPAICVAGFRYGISIDYIKVYQRGFQQIIHRGTADGFEWGFNLISVVLSKIISKPEFLFFTYAAITILLYFISFKESKDFFISVVLLFGTGVYFDCFNGIRQYLVVAVFMYCFRYIKQKNITKYMVIMGLCTLIHTSAVFTLPLYFLHKIKFDVKKLLIVLAAVFLAKIYLYNGVLFIMRLIPKYSIYITRNTIENQISFSTSGLTMALLALVPSLIVNKKMQENAEGKYLYNMVMLGLIIAVCTSFLPLAERLMYYTRSYFIFSIPYACSLMKKGIKRNLIEYGTVTLMTAMNFIGIIFLNWYAVLPYVTIFTR